MTAMFLALVMGSPAPPKEPTPPPLVTVTCVDGSNLKVKLLDEFLTLGTKYGDLKVPVSVIKSVEFANRTPADVEAEIVGAVKNLAHPDFQTREKASAKLKEIGPRAFPACCKAAKDGDPEVARRGDEAAKAIKGKHSNLTLRPLDIVHTDDSKVSGTIKGESLKVMTEQFGEQNLRLSHMDKLSSGLVVPDDAKPAPDNLNTPDYQNKPGQEFSFKVTGVAANPGTPGLWGSGPYTLDSKIAIAAVHAGLVKVGESGVVRVRLVASPATFEGTTANGVTSVNYGNFPAGAYEFVK